MAVTTYRGVLIADSTVDELAAALSGIEDAPELQVAVAPFGQVAQVLLGGVEADFAVVWTRPEAIVPSFARILDAEPVTPEQLLDEVDRFCEWVRAGCVRCRFAFVPTWTVPHWHRGVGIAEVRERGVARALAQMNVRLMERLSGEPGIYVLDAQRWIEAVGPNARNPRLWYLGKIAFHSDVFVEAAREIKAGIRALTGLSRKLLVLDLDDTIWGGSVGEVGWEQLRLGGHDAEGEAFADFQRALAALSRRGVLLAAVSKSSEDVALEAIRRHPAMVLRESDFAAWRIDWRDKASHVAAIAAELKLGLDAVVFVDDSPLERARVREVLPEVLVPEWPADPLLFASALHALRCFDTPGLSREDRERSTLYAQERTRRASLERVGSLQEWLATLDTVVEAEPLGPGNLVRAAQLVNKTSQMNLATRRLTERELLEWARKEGRTVWVVRVSDRFGDAGATGVVSVEVEGDRARIVDFLLSCRVMGRGVERAMAHLAVEHARALGLARVEARLRRTERNGPCVEFWRGSGFESSGDDGFEWDARQPFPRPEAIALERRG